jgi:spore coat protein U-like protein
MVESHLSMRAPARHLPILAAAVLSVVPALASAANCRTTVATSLAFGNYDPFSTVALDAVGQLELRCSAKSTATVSISAGSSGTFAARQLRSPNGALEYNVFLDAARQVVWNSLNVYFSTERTELVPIYARIFPRQIDASAGTYTDTLVVTVEF